jgi:hypothetical protein
MDRLYDWSAERLEHSLLRDLLRGGSPTYATEHPERHAWNPAPVPMRVRALGQQPLLDEALTYTQGALTHFKPAFPVDPLSALPS